MNPKIFDLNNRDFVISLFLDLYVRHPTQNEVDYFVERLDANRFGKQQLYEHFLTTKEYQKKEHYFILDRVNDPFENTFLNPRENPILMNEYLNHFENLIDLERSDARFINKQPSQDFDSEELSEIEEELHKLGYI